MNLKTPGIILHQATYPTPLFPQKESKELIHMLESKTFDIRQNIIVKDKKTMDDIIIITVDDPSYEYSYCYISI